MSWAPPLLVRLTLPALAGGGGRALGPLRRALGPGLPRERWALVAGRLACSRPERAFARALLLRHPHLWLYRTLQGAGCGDFLVVDMASPDPARRRLVLVELKQGRPARWGGAGLQAQHVDRAVAALAAAGRVALDAPCRVVSGEPAGVLRLVARRPRRRRHPRPRDVRREQDHDEQRLDGPRSPLEVERSLLALWPRTRDG